MIATIDDIAGSKTKTPSRSTFVAATPGRHIRVWLTDDNAIFRSLLEELLTRSGEFNCEQQFHSAESLLGGLANGPAPDVILLDVEMGGMTGVDALRLIRAIAPNVRVLIITSFFDPAYEAQAARDGASAFLIKADAPQKLVREIHRALVSPVKTLFPVADVSQSAGQKSPSVGVPLTRRNLAIRFCSWVAHFSVNLFRPAPVSTAGSHS